MNSFKKSDSIKNIATALATSQAEIENATKNSNNPHYKYSYANLAEVINTIKPIFSKNGLSIIQIPSYESSIANVETILLHVSGEFISGISSCRVPKDDPQGVGSATTYLRRYALAAFSFISQEDDDAESSINRNDHTKKIIEKKQQIILAEEIQLRQDEMLHLISESTTIDELKEKYLVFSKEILSHVNCAEFSKELNTATTKQKEFLLKNKLNVG